jgi:PPIC-type PPIASE domain
MPNASNPHSRLPRRLLREPLVHFFGVGALLFLVQHLLVGDPRTITVTPGLSAELTRRFQDLNGRKPNPAELATALQKWERDEALFREALREHLDRDDPSVRTALVDKMHALAAFEVPKREPTEAELQSWLGAHRSLYETPLRYDFEFVAFPKAEPAAAEHLEKFARATQEGANASTLGRSVIGGNLTTPEMKDRIPPELAERIPSLPLGQWQRLETKQSLLLARVNHVEGGLPSPEELRARLIADWSFATRQDAAERILQHTVDRYRIEPRP